MHTTSLDSNHSSLIPITCHYDERTLLTKNGDLIQIIEIKGFGINDETPGQSNLQHLVMSAILECVENNQYAIYFHTINNLCDIFPLNELSSKFTSEVDKEWKNVNHWGSHLVNTLYITVVHQGQRNHPLHPRYLWGSFFANANKKQRFAFFEKAAMNLTKVVDKMLSLLSHFQGRVLTLKEKGSKVISEPVSFIYNIIYMQQGEIPLSLADFSNVLSHCEINYDFNSFVLRGSEYSTMPVQERHAALFSVKGVQSLNYRLCQRILEISHYHIITEALLFNSI